MVIFVTNGCYLWWVRGGCFHGGPWVILHISIGSRWDYTDGMKKIPLTVVAASLLTVCLAFAQVSAPPSQDRTEVETDQKEARVTLKIKERLAMRTLTVDYDAQARKLKADQAAEKQAMLEKMQ